MEYSPNQRFGGGPSRSPALSTHSARDMDHVRTPAVGPSKNEFLSPALNSQHRSMARIDSAPVMLTDFVASGRTGPWNQFVAFPENGNQSSSVQSIGSTFYDFRNPASVSVASDSGYASLSKRLVEEMSFMGDGSFHPDIQTISAGIGTVNFNATNAREQEMQASNSERTITTSTKAGSELRCPECKEPVKTKSMLKKHLQRHKRPFVCKEPNCSRDEGFGTQNDLDRHKLTVHGIFSPKTRKLYKCTLDRCKDKQKYWPRADNFRSHLKSVHHISQDLTGSHAYLDGFLCQALMATSARPPCENGSDLLQGVGAGSVGSELGPGGFPNAMTNWPIDGFSVLPADQSVISGGDQTMADHDDLHLEPMDGVMRSPISKQSWGHPDIPPQVQETLSHLPRSRPVSALGRADSGEDKPFPVPSQRRTYTTSSTGTTSTIEPRLTYRRPTHKDTNCSDLASQRTENANAEITDNEGLSSASTLRRQPDEPMVVKTDSSYAAELETTSKSREAVSREDKAQEEDEMIKVLDGIPTEVLSRYLKQQGISSTSDGFGDSGDPGTKQKHQCTRCERKFPRRSELNKHLRRHDKPYGCTFPKCNSHFGSKSDWRRHENTQHFQLAVWKCDELIGEGVVCPKTCYGRNVFEGHLRKDHHIDEKDVVARQNRCRVDRSTNDRFWCGFCKDVIAVNPQVNNGAWGERYDHIGNHFTGCNGFPKVNKGVWKCGDTESSDEDTEEAEEMDTDSGSAKRKRDDSEEGGRPVKKPRGQRV